MFTARNHIFYNVGTGFYGTHGCRVEFGAERAIESPITIYPSVVIAKNSRIEPEYTISGATVVIPIAYLKRTIGTIGFSYHVLSAADLVVRT